MTVLLSAPRDKPARALDLVGSGQLAGLSTWRGSTDAGDRAPAWRRSRVGKKFRKERATLARASGRSAESRPRWLPAHARERAARRKARQRAPDQGRTRGRYRSMLWNDAAKRSATWATSGSSGRSGVFNGRAPGLDGGSRSGNGAAHCAAPTAQPVRTPPRIAHRLPVVKDPAGRATAPRTRIAGVMPRRATPCVGLHAISPRSATGSRDGTVIAKCRLKVPFVGHNGS